jgi:hypothetical protein
MIENGNWCKCWLIIVDRDVCVNGDGDAIITVSVYVHVSADEGGYSRLRTNSDCCKCYPINIDVTVTVDEKFYSYFAKRLRSRNLLHSYSHHCKYVPSGKEHPIVSLAFMR